MKQGCILSMVLLLVSFSLRAQTIITFAGNNSAGYSGDGGPATAAQINEPDGIAIDLANNIYISDGQNNVIRKINNSGVITTVAGNNTPGFSGDGGGATLAQLAGPTGVAVDKFGNLFICDYGNKRIRKVNSSGIISTIAGNGTAGYTGDGIAATATEIDGPFGITTDSVGDVYFADALNNRIRKINLTGIITTVAGTGTGGYSGDGVAATSAELFTPQGIAIDSLNNLYVSDNGNNRIRKLNSSGIITTVAGNGIGGYSGDGVAATSTSLEEPGGVFVKGGEIFIADRFNNRIRKVNSIGIISTIAGDGTPGYSGDGGPATAALLALPNSVIVDTSGNCYIADGFNNVIREVINNTTGIKNIVSDPVFHVYPNPANDKLFITGLSGDFSYSIYSISGAFVKQNRLQNGNDLISIQDINPGTYFLEINSGYSNCSKVSFIKE